MVELMRQLWLTLPDVSTGENRSGESNETNVNGGNQSIRDDDIGVEMLCTVSIKLARDMVSIKMGANERQGAGPSDTSLPAEESSCRMQ